MSLTLPHNYGAPGAEVPRAAARVSLPVATPVIRMGTVVVQKKRGPKRKLTDGLTDRQLETMRLWVLSGSGLRGVAVTMGLSIKTVEKHMTCAYECIGADEVHSQLGVARWLLKRGHITLPEFLGH